MSCSASNTRAQQKTKAQPAISNMCAIRITGNAQDRFVQAAVLLHMLDPVRGEPTAHGLDQDPHELETPRERLSKQKFLDSFALLCAIKKDGDSISAACMEDGLPQGTIIRIASNAGVRESTLYQLQKILDSLNSVADAGDLRPVSGRTGISCIAWLRG
jgi:hypothetical protein